MYPSVRENSSSARNRILVIQAFLSYYIELDVLSIHTPYTKYHQVLNSFGDKICGQGDGDTCQLCFCFVCYAKNFRNELNATARSSRLPGHLGVTPLLHGNVGMETYRLHCAAILEHVSETRLIYYDQLRRFSRAPSRLFQP